MMKLKVLFYSFCVCLLSINLSAQDFGYGIKAGLNFSSFLGPQELDDTGLSLDEYSNNTGFHVGATFNFSFLDNYGIRGEFQYNQRGTSYKYDGIGYFAFDQGTSTPIYATGQKRTILSIKNAYLEVPVMGYAKLNQSFEVTAGIHIGALISCSAAGEITFEGSSDNTGQEIPSQIITLEHNYRTDPIGFADGTEFSSFMIDNKAVKVPVSQGAYADYEEKDGSYFTPFDIGVNAGLNFYLNEGLYVGIRAQYGFIDVTKKFYDRSLYKLNADKTFIQQDHKDNNLNFQLSMGFTI